MESELQRKIREDLELKGWYVHKVMKSSRGGWPDLEAFKSKTTIFIETKSAKKDARPLQKYQHNKLREQGFDVFVIDSWDSYLHHRNRF